jgi:asparagine synthase (glutamine-hydrolysing)
MAGIAGWIGEGSPQIVGTIASLLTRSDHGASDSAISPRCALVVADAVGRRSLFQDGDWITAVWGRPRFDDSTLDEVARKQGSAAAALRAYRDQGPAFLARVHGTVSIAIVNGQHGEALITTDRAGIHPVVYTPTRNGVVFASRSDALHLHPEIHPRLDHQSLYNYVHFHMVPGPSTIHVGERRLLPGEMIVFRSGKLSVERYWRMHFQEDQSRPFSELQGTFLSTLGDSVKQALDGASVGCFLSGGTDSSTISGMVGRVTGKPASTFSIGFDEPGYDEMDFARIAVKHFGTDHHEYYVTPDDIVYAIPKLVEIHDQPFGNSSAVPTYFCARMAREHGVTTLLAGDGGDELFGGNERYATQQLLSLYERVPEMGRSLILEPLARLSPSRIPPFRWYKRLVEIASTPMPARLDTYNLLTRLGPETVFTRGFLESIDRTVPALIMQAAYDDTNANSLINRMLALDFKVTLADNDLPKVTRSCELAGVDVAFPLLDDQIIAFAERLQPRLKLKGTKLRFFFKEALRGFIPEEIIRKKKHGFGLPFGPWLRRHAPLRTLVFDSLSTLKQRQIIRSEFIDDLQSQHLEQHASYFGTMAWVLMMLEQWLHSHSHVQFPCKSQDII